MVGVIPDAKLLVKALKKGFNSKPTKLGYVLDRTLKGKKITKRERMFVERVTKDTLRVLPITNIRRKTFKKSRDQHSTTQKTNRLGRKRFFKSEKKAEAFVSAWLSRR